MKKLLFTVGILLFLALVAGILWFVRGGDRERASRDVVADVVEVQGDAVASGHDTAREKVESTEKNTDTQHMEKSVDAAQKQGASQNNTTVSAVNIDTSAWQEYCNEEYGFCVRYPGKWEVKKYRTFSIFPVPGPIDCEKTPEKCPYEGLLFSKKYGSNGIKYFNIQQINSKEDYPEFEQNNTWMTGLITGCLMNRLIKKNKKAFILYTFYYDDESDNLDGNDSSNILKKECENNVFVNDFDRIVDTFVIID